MYDYGMLTSKQSLRNIRSESIESTKQKSSRMLVTNLRRTKVESRCNVCTVKSIVVLPGHSWEWFSQNICFTAILSENRAISTVQF